MGARHFYFAYGSHLCVQQMARRCPDATEPRRALLADHDWLINERGVATVEPFAGSEVHGVLWRLSDRDLATLDSAEGVPAPPGANGLSVSPGQGRWRAGFYTAPRTEAAPPRPGYLERILDGARHH